MNDREQTLENLLQEVLDLYDQSYFTILDEDDLVVVETLMSRITQELYSE